MRLGQVIDARKEGHALVAEEVASVIFAGGTVIFPTDTVYGIGGDPFNPSALARIYDAKTRPLSKPLSLHLATLAEFLEYAREYREVSGVARRLMPGPVTVIIPKPAFIDDDVTAGLETLGFRVPDDSLCSQILERCGPLAATSANISGERAYYGGGDWEALPQADLLVENGPTKHRQDSTVIDMTKAQPIVLREGVVSIQRLSELLGPAFHPILPHRRTP